MGRKGNRVTYPEFRSKSKDEQLESILSLSSNCIDGAPTYLARWIEIYLDATPEDQLRRRKELHDRWNQERLDKQAATDYADGHTYDRT